MQLLYSCISLCMTQSELEMGDAFLLFPQYKSVSSPSLKVGAILSLKFKGNFEYKQTLPYCCLYNHIYKEVKWFAQGHKQYSNFCLALYLKQISRYHLLRTHLQFSFFGSMWTLSSKVKLPISTISPFLSILINCQGFMILLWGPHKEKFPCQALLQRTPWLSLPKTNFKPLTNTKWVMLSNFLVSERVNTHFLKEKTIKDSNSTIIQMLELFQTLK